MALYSSPVILPSPVVCIHDVSLFVVVNRTWMTALLESVCYLTKEVIKGDVSNFIRVKLYIHMCTYMS